MTGVQIGGLVLISDDIVQIVSDSLGDRFVAGGVSHGRVIWFTVRRGSGSESTFLWRVSNAEVTQIASRLRSGERSGYGTRSGGVYTLANLVWEAVEKHSGECDLLWTGTGFDVIDRASGVPKGSAD